MPIEIIGIGHSCGYNLFIWQWLENIGSQYWIFGIVYYGTFGVHIGNSNETVCKSYNNAYVFEFSEDVNYCEYMEI